MRKSFIHSSCLLSLLVASAASAVTMDWRFVGNPGNPADTEVMNDGTTGYGPVPYAYNIGTYEVTNAQYAEFLNAKAIFDPLSLYNPGMGNPVGPLFAGGITRSGVSGSYSYTPIAGREEMPVNWVSLWDAMRFANWMHNGQGSGNTETGAYTLLGGTPTPSNVTTVTRNPSATIFLPSENEWYKAAYYQAESASYFDYPTSSNAQPTCSAPTATPNRANCGSVADHNLTIKGSYVGSLSPYGTFDQGGNVTEWSESKLPNNYRQIRGGAFDYNVQFLAASTRNYTEPSGEDSAWGFRVAMIPEPSTGLFVSAGLLGLAGWRRARA